MDDSPAVLAVTCGEPAGIGPEIALRAAWALRETVPAVLIGDAAQLQAIAHAIDPAIRLQVMPAGDSRPLHRIEDGCLGVIDSPVQEAVVPGRLDARNGRAVLRSLDIAIDGALSGQFGAIVTAPLQKSTINEAGVPFTGHTEYLAERTGTPEVVMMLAGPLAGTQRMLRVALATTHLPLKDVPQAITGKGLIRTLEIIHRDLCGRFGLARPRILVTGLNPHAGEGGYLGREEIDVIQPALEQARLAGIDAAGPYPADTLFQEKYLADADCVLAMYHDQGLPVLKHATFGRGVNITLGLPIIRTSVDHGTALDIAAQGLGRADHGSMVEAMQIAAGMAKASSSMRK